MSRLVERGDVASCNGLASRNRRQQRHLVPVPYACVQLDVPQVHRGERALRDITGSRKLLPHAAHHVADRGGKRYGHSGFGTAHQLGVAGEKADANRTGRGGERHIRWEGSRHEPPVVPVVSPRQILACFGPGSGACVTVNALVVRSLSWVVRVMVWPLRSTVIGSGVPAWPR